jgi:hypothetical protein
VQYDLPSKERFTRSVTAPDGSTHLITMEGWYWNSLDWMHDCKGWTDRDFIEMAWESARDIQRHDQATFPNSIATTFAKMLEAHIWYRCCTFMNEEDGVCNDI